MPRVEQRTDNHERPARASRNGRPANVERVPRTWIELVWGVVSRPAVTLNVALLVAVAGVAVVVLVTVLGPSGLAIAAGAGGIGRAGQWVAQRLRMPVGPASGPP